jgi:hypothetical protein
MTTIEKIAINIITSKNLDFHKICIGVAKNYPEALVENCREYRWAIECKKLAGSDNKADGKVKAIKLWRESSGDSLEESKIAIGKL